MTFENIVGKAENAGYQNIFYSFNNNNPINQVIFTLSAAKPSIWTLVKYFVV